MKNRIMIVREKNNSPSMQNIQELYRFLKHIRGNYRNALYTSCSCGCEYMLTADRDAKPILFPIRKFYKLTGEYPQQDEMCVVLSRQAFQNMYRGWLLWNANETECLVCSVYNKMKAEVL